MGPAATPAPFTSDTSDDRSLAPEFPGDPSVGRALCRLKRAWQLSFGGRRLMRWAAVSRAGAPRLAAAHPEGAPPGGRRRRMVATVTPALDEGHGDRQHAEQRQDPRRRMGHAVDGTGLLFIQAPIGRPPFRKNQARVWSPTMPGAVPRRGSPRATRHGPCRAAAAPGRLDRPVARAAWPGHLDGAPIVAQADAERAVADRVAGQADAPPPGRA